jgi:hypothetical protein
MSKMYVSEPRVETTRRGESHDLPLRGTLEDHFALLYSLELH